MKVDVADAPEHERWEARIDGELVGFARYRRHEGSITFFHTEVHKEGAGIGALLVRRSLDAAREAGERVHPVCPFYAGWIERHPDYGDLVHDEAPRLGEET